MKNRIAIALAAALSIVTLASAGDDRADARARAKARVGQVNALLAKGAVGLDARGYLVVRGGVSKEESGVVEEENKDRKALHADIARQSKTSVEAVERRSVPKFQQLLPKGAWYQDAGGKWVQKK